MDPHAKGIDVSDVIGKIVVLTVETKPKATDPSQMKNVVSDVSAFRGDLAEINQIMDEALNMTDPDEDLSKKKA